MALAAAPVQMCRIVCRRLRQTSQRKNLRDLSVSPAGTGALTMHRGDFVVVGGEQ